MSKHIRYVSSHSLVADNRLGPLRDGCAINGNYWVLTAAATNVEYSIMITDTTSQEEWTYDNPLGMRSQAVTDTSAFACSP